MASSAITTPKSSKFSTDSISKVRVIVRVRQFLPQEIAGDPVVSCVSVVDQEAGAGSADEVTVHLKDQNTSRNECYKLDSFFGQEDNNVGQIFEREVSPLIPGIFRGCKATVFAYGATGSGKTYTMQGSDELPGLMPLAMSSILSMCQRTGSTAEISYYEVYMDRCYDLLEVKAKEIAILDDRDGKIHLKGLSRVEVKSMSEFSEVFSCGIQRRKVAHTGLNDVSSRSHGVLVIAVSTPSADGTRTVNGKLNLIDLAGNEDNRRTCNEGIRLQESAKINQSLFALSNVIYALNNNRTRVPYRESKLTRILQDSLGGTSHALMVACLNPGVYQESVHTVSLAARSRHISNFVSSAQKQKTPKHKVDMEAKLLAWLEAKGKTKSVLRKGVFGSPFLGKTPSSASSIAKSSVHNNTSKAKRCVNRGVCNTKERMIPTPSKNLFCNEDPVDPCLETLHLHAENKEDKAASADGILPDSNTLPPDEKRCIRKALSPISCNVKQSCPVSFEPETPKTPFITNKEFQTNGTPLDKFHTHTSNLKRTLVQEYINFLNTANKEELMDVKGIGLKRADYILEVRETSPLQSLRDLEKIGLSSKEVHNMFNSAARGIFDRTEDTTPCC